MSLVALPAHIPDLNADEAFWDWVREEGNAVTCFVRKARVSQAVDSFFAGLASRTAEASRRCRTPLHSRADILTVSTRHQNADFTPALLQEAVEYKMTVVIQTYLQETEIAARLHGQWNLLVQNAGGHTTSIDDEFGKMVSEYHSGRRFYHNLIHIGKVDEMLNKYDSLAKNWTSLKFAGDGHDVVYVPGSQSNEADSALFMRGIMTRLGMPSDIIGETERLILLTKHHRTTEDECDGKLLMDADFAIFASPEEEYDAYVQGIWKEYGGSGKVSEMLFRWKRRKLVEGWLKQDRIFLIDEIGKDLEPLARKNLERERMGKVHLI